MFGQNVVLRHPHKIHIDDNVVIDDNCLLDAKGDSNAGIWIRSGSYIGRNSILSCKNGDIVLERDVNIGFNCEIFSGSQVVVGEGTMLAAYVYLVGGDHVVSDPTLAIAKQRRISRGIAVGAGTWLGAGVKVLDGVDIGDRVIVGAGAVVRRSLPEGVRAVGVPARILPTKTPLFSKGSE